MAMRFPLLRAQPFVEAMEWRRAEISAPAPSQLARAAARALPVSGRGTEALAETSALANAHFALADLLYCAGASLEGVAAEQKAGLEAANALLESLPPLLVELAHTEFLRHITSVLPEALATALLIAGREERVFVEAYTRVRLEWERLQPNSSVAALAREFENGARAILYHHASSPEALLENAYSGTLDLYGLSGTLAKPESKDASDAWRGLLWWWAQTLYAGPMRALVYGVDARSTWLEPRTLVVLKTAARLGLLDVQARIPITMRPFVAYLAPSLETRFEPLPQEARCRQFLEAVVEHSSAAEGEGLQPAARFLVEIGWGVRDYGGHFPTAAQDLLDILRQRWAALRASLKSALAEATANPSRMCRASGHPPPAEWLRLVRQEP